ncbi:hypothetical protein SACC_28860 [Saccharolobus caldissimus]|uniref:Polysaccharide biosynthesis protein C-terminal domain-containing protein n=1 Tax=Saccharolobus caldissimus TaxID=1702097 RepID=A0AAQ4CVN8_9CREN|nr:polysaccharide biosynthesis C-terminal domain-containing protein [Saccharolobus caldissimus]BDB99869.1 hypothetical protein SACC_28860 [Saccharolobus caldissimus]
MTLPFPIQSLVNFIIASKKDLRPFLVLSIINGGLTLLTSFLLIPRLGVVGGAISQVIVSILSSSFIVFYALRTSTFIPSRKEIMLLLSMPLMGIYEVFVDPQFLDLILLLLVILIFKAFKVIEKEDVKLVESFLPSKLKFISYILQLIS